MRTVLVCSAGFGEGHHTAARNLCAALDELGGPREVRAEFVDLLAKRHPRVSKLLAGSYLAVLNRTPWLWAAVYRRFDHTPGSGVPDALFATLRAALVELLERTRPAAVVATYPLYGYVLDDIARRGGPRDFLRVTLITDSTTVNAIWLRCGTDFYSVPDEGTAAAVRQAGIPGEKVRVLGFPVHPRFAALAAQTGLRPDPADKRPGVGRRLFYLVNSGNREVAPATVRLLLENVEGLALTVGVGRNARLRGAVERAASSTGRPVNVIGWTDEVPELLASHHLVLTKAGGATVQEAIAAGCPLLLSQVAPGQEEGNAQLVLEADAGRLALTPEETVFVVREAFANNAALCRRWGENLARLRRPDAARENARFVLEQIGC